MTPWSLARPATKMAAVRAVEVRVGARDLPDADDSLAGFLQNQCARLTEAIACLGTAAQAVAETGERNIEEVLELYQELISESKG